MPFSTPPTASNGNPIASSHVNTLRDNDNWFNGLLANPMQAGQVPIASSTSAAAYGFLGAASITDGTIGTAQLADQAVGSTQIQDGAVDSTALAAAVVALLPAAGTGGWFRTAAEIPAGWARETNGDGRFFVGAGTTFSTTFVEETNYGSSWSHSHPISTSGSATVSNEGGTAQTVNFTGSGGVDTASHGHNHPVSSTSSSDAWTIPSRAYVASRKT